jgi:hypothetical protein
MEENKEVSTNQQEQVNDVIKSVEKGELTDVMLVCMIMLTFQYSINGTAGKTHLTVDELFTSLDRFFIIEKSRVESTLYEMCVGNICGQWLRKSPDGTEVHEYTLKSFQLRDGEVRVVDMTP